MNKITLKITGITCASCAINIKKNLEKKEGVILADVNTVSAKANISYKKNKISEEEIKEIIVKTGYGVDEKTKEPNKDQEDKNHGHHNHVESNEKLLKIKVFLSILLTLPIFVRMFWSWEVPGQFLGISLTNWIQHDLAFIVVFIFGWQFHKSAFKGLKRFNFNMDSLISLGTFSAYLYSFWAMFNGGHIYFESAATITSLILLGRFFELKTKNRASRAMEKLMQLGVKKARVVTSSGEEVEKDVDDIEKEEVILIKPGEKIPLDGVVIEGSANLDEAMLTGESLPVHKEEGDKVFGATINKDGILKIRVTKTGEETMLSQIIKAVEEAQEFKAPIQKLADKIAGIFVPTVIVIAIFTFLGWYFFTGEVSTAIINAVAVLIISCPCALGIATPIAVMVGSSVGAKNGILIKDGESFEKSRKIDVVIFDKTGTLTKGEPSVEKMTLNNNLDFTEEQLIKISSSLASKSDHPLSRAVQEKYNLENKDLATISDYEEVSGRGLIGKCSAHQTKLFLGNIRLLKENNIETSWAEKEIEKHAHSGGTVIFVAHGDKVAGSFLIADQIKDSAYEAIEGIKKLGLEPIMISGDNKNTVRNVGEKLKIDNFLAEVLPQEKQNEVIKLQKENKKVIFVGDGINDAPSLAQADLGIAMGSGTDIAKETGGIIIMKNDPLKVVETIKLSRKTFTTIKQNLFWAFAYNVLAIPLAVFGFVSPMVGAIAMSLSDVTVIGNSLRIYNNKKNN